MRDAVRKRRWGGRGACAALVAIPLVLGLLRQASPAAARLPSKGVDAEALAFDPFSLGTDLALASAPLSGVNPTAAAGSPGGLPTLGAEARTRSVVRPALLIIIRRPAKRTPILPPWP